MASLKWALLTILFVKISANVNLLWKCSETDETNDKTFICAIEGLDVSRFDLCIERHSIKTQTELVIKQWRAEYQLNLGDLCPQLTKTELYPKSAVNCNHVPKMITTNCLPTTTTNGHLTTMATATTTATTAAAATTIATTASTATTTATTATTIATTATTATTTPETTSAQNINFWTYLGYSTVGIVFLLGLVGAVLIYRRTKGRSTDIELQTIGEETQVKTVLNPEYKPFDHELSRMETENLPSNQATPALSAIRATKASISTIENLF